MIDWISVEDRLPEDGPAVKKRWMPKNIKNLNGVRVTPQYFERLVGGKLKGAKIKIGRYLKKHL